MISFCVIVAFGDKVAIVLVAGGGLSSNRWPHSLIAFVCGSSNEICLVAKQKELTSRTNKILLAAVDLQGT